MVGRAWASAPTVPVQHLEVRAPRLGPALSTCGGAKGCRRRAGRESLRPHHPHASRVRIDTRDCHGIRGGFGSRPSVPPGRSVAPARIRLSTLARSVRALRWSSSLRDSAPLPNRAPRKGKRGAVIEALQEVYRAQARTPDYPLLFSFQISVFSFQFGCRPQTDAWPPFRAGSGSAGTTHEANCHGHPSATTGTQ
jgi:hypothetical protein